MPMILLWYSIYMAMIGPWYNQDMKKNKNGMAGMMQPWYIHDVAMIMLWHFCDMIDEEYSLNLIHITIYVKSITLITWRQIKPTACWHTFAFSFCSTYEQFKPNCHSLRIWLTHFYFLSNTEAFPAEFPPCFCVSVCSFMTVMSVLTWQRRPGFRLVIGPLRNSSAGWWRCQREPRAHIRKRAPHRHRARWWRWERRRESRSGI